MLQPDSYQQLQHLLLPNMMRWMAHLLEINYSPSTSNCQRAHIPERVSLKWCDLNLVQHLSQEQPCLTLTVKEGKEGKGREANKQTSKQANKQTNEMITIHSIVVAFITQISKTFQLKSKNGSSQLNLAISQVILHWSMIVVEAKCLVLPD